jgi:ferric-dicitrate binding protein FerR (iron transport regulator)
MKQNEHINDLIIQLLSGSISNDDRAALEDWVDGSDENLKYFRQQQELWFSATTEQSLQKYDSRKAFAYFLQRIGAAAKCSEPSDRKSSPWSLPRWLRYAAVLVVMCAVGWFAYERGESRMMKHFADIVIEAPEGARTRTILPDGSVVWLNAGSRLSYSQGFGIRERGVRLDGEGYFEVAKDTARPFYVTSTSLKVSVLGTKFDFRDYADDDESFVKLAQGSVALDNLVQPGQNTCLKPGQQAVLNKRTGELTVSNSDVEDMRQWTTGKLIFHGEAMADIARKMEHCYNVQINILSDSLFTFRFFGEFNPAEQTIEDVLRNLAATQKLHYRIKGRVIDLY